VTTERQQLEAGIAALEAQRTVRVDAVVDAMLGPVRAHLAALLDAAPAPEPEQQLRQVSILFLGVAGPIPLAQQPVPEVAAGRVNPFPQPRNPIRTRAPW
jgi:hypothetical protein